MIRSCHILRAGFAAAALVILEAAWSPPAAATTYYWDTNGATSGIGSAGGAAANWLTNSWATGNAGNLTTAVWPNEQDASADAAVFQGTAGTVNVSADVYANALTFQTNNYTIASTGGALRLSGPSPMITVNLPSNGNMATISAPILGDSGFTLTGNSTGSSLKFLMLANTSAGTPNDFQGTLTIDASAALRLGGGVSREQIPDNVDLAVAGVLDFITSGGASDGKLERVRNVAVSGASSNFSIGNEADVIVNSISATSTSGPGIAINGNSATAPNAPGRLIIDGWADGSGDLTLDNGKIQLNTTGASFGIGGRILLAGDIQSTGASQIYNNNGGTTPEDNHFDNKALDFTGATHTINVASGTFSLSSRTPSQFIDVTSTRPEGTTLVKTGPGIWFWEHAAETSFTGVNRVEEGTWRLGLSEQLANGSKLEVAGGTFDMQGFAERVATVKLDGGSIAGTAAATLIAEAYDVRSGSLNVRAQGAANLTKAGTGTATLGGANGYSGTTTVDEGVLVVNGQHSGGSTYTVHDGATLGGTGSIDAPLVLDGGTLAPGTSIGAFTVNNDVTFATGSRLKIELAGSAADKIVVQDLELSAVEQLEISVSAPLSGDSWLIAQYSGARNGEFDAVTPGYFVDYAVPGAVYLRLAVPGDYNADGAVDAADYTLWRNFFGQSGANLPADGTGPASVPDGTVDMLDYALWKSHFGESVTAGSAARGPETAVPEPMAGSSVVIALALGRCRRRRPLSV